MTWVCSEVVHHLVVHLFSSSPRKGGEHMNMVQMNGYLSLSRQFLSKCPWSTAHCSISLSSRMIWRPTSALCLAFARSSFEVRPWMVFDAASLAKPSVVFGPELAAPCKRHLPTGKRAGLWHRVPLLVLAKHFWPCQSGPNNQGLELLFITLKIQRFMGFYYNTKTHLSRWLVY